MKKIYLLFLVLFSSFIYSQTNGITYQAVILKPEGEKIPGYNNERAPLINTHICLRFTINAGTALEYQETIQTTTDEFGMVNVVIGTGAPTANTVVPTFSAIVWNGNPKSLVVEVDLKGYCWTFKEISNQPFTAVPYALYAANAGVPGVPGVAGPQGIQGLKGDKGDTGAKGADGIAGTQGIQGIPGIKGDTGVQGLE